MIMRKEAGSTGGKWIGDMESIIERLKSNSGTHSTVLPQWRQQYVSGES